MWKNQLKYNKSCGTLYSWNRFTNAGAVVRSTPTSFGVATAPEMACSSATMMTNAQHNGLTRCSISTSWGKGHNNGLRCFYWSAEARYKKPFFSKGMKCHWLICTISWECRRLTLGQGSRICCVSRRGEFNSSLFYILKTTRLNIIFILFFQWEQRDDEQNCWEDLRVSSITCRVELWDCRDLWAGARVHQRGRLVRLWQLVVRWRFHNPKYSPDAQGPSTWATYKWNQSSYPSRLLVHMMLGLARYCRTGCCNCKYKKQR